MGGRPIGTIHLYPDLVGKTKIPEQHFMNRSPIDEKPPERIALFEAVPTQMNLRILDRKIIDIFWTPLIILGNPRNTHK